MSRFRELSAFVAVAEEGAFNAAARRLNLSASVVTRLISAMEGRIGTRLFTRTTRSVTLTDAGERLHSEAVQILLDLDQAEAHAAGAHQTPKGILRLTAPVMFGQQYIMPLVRGFLSANEEVTASVTLLDRVVHLIDEGFDVGVRIGELADSSLFARQVGTIRRMTIASPEYLKLHGEPSHPHDLSKRQIINTSGLHGSDEWIYEAGGKVVKARVAPKLTTNTISPAIDAAIAGWGITRVLSYQVANEMASGDLIEIMGEWEDRKIPINLLYADGRQAAAKVRAFLDFATGALQTESFG